MNKDNRFSDLQLMDAIRKGGSDRNRSVQYLIKTFTPLTFKFSRKFKLEEQVAKDAFTDTLMVFIDHVNRNIFKGECKVSTYLYRIFNNKCVDVLRKNTTNKVRYPGELPQVQDESQKPLKKIFIEEDMEILSGYLGKLSEKCGKILMDWGYWGYKMEEIAERNDLKNAKSARNQKHKCMTKLMQIIQNNWNYGSE